MKRKLLATTALTIGALVIPGIEDAAAEGVSVKVGGYMEQFFGYMSQDLSTSDPTGFDVKSDTEIHFKGAATLDNGITFGINVQLEGNTSSDQIDESYMTVGGEFGQLNIGSENSVLYLMHVKPKDYGFGMNSGDNVEWMVFDGIGGNTGVFRGPFGSTAVEPARMNDVNRLSYFTPRFAGFQLGASYVPKNREDDNTNPDRDTELHDGGSFAVNYESKLAGAEIAASAGWGFVQQGKNSTGGDPASYNFGLSVGVGEFTVAGSYARAENDLSVGDMNGLNLGVRYEPNGGPWKFAVLGFFSDRDGSPTANAGGSGARKAELQTGQVEVSYALGPGVNIVGVLGHAQINDETDFGEDSQSTFLVSGVRLSF